MNAANTAPFVFPAEHMLYHAPSNSLIASTSRSWTPNSCGPDGSSVFKIPLSSDGSRVAGPTTCASVDAPWSCDILSLDYLPSGSVLVTTSTGATLGGAKLFAVDPSTMSVALWADPTQFDVDGGCFSLRIGKAIILDDSTNALRTFIPGQADGGSLLSCTVPVGGPFSGQAPVEMMWEIDTNGPGCFGTEIPFGPGLAGAGGIVPSLDIVGCPDVGQVFTFSATAVLGGATGVLIAGPAPAFIPIAGGFLYVDPISIMLDIAASGAPGVAGSGSFVLPVFLTDPALAGLTLFLQAGFIDPAAVQGVSLSNGLAFILG